MPKRLSTSDTLELGVSGLKHSGGMIREEFARDLQGRKAVKAYRQMRDEDPIVGGTMLAIESLLMQVEMRVEPASTDSVDVEAADFLMSAIDGMEDDWSQTLVEILTKLTYGWSALEIVYMRRADGRIGWKRWAPRSQDSLLRWELDENGRVIAMTQSAPPDFKPRLIPVEKLLLFRVGASKANPEGRSLLRNAYRPHWRKSHIENIEGIGIERDLAGLPVVYAPAAIMAATANANDRATFENLKELVRNIRRDEQEGVVFPRAYGPDGKPLYELTLLSTGGRRQFDTTEIIKRLDAAMAMSVLADFILLGHEQTGSFALSSSKTDLFATALGSFLKSIYGTINRHAVPRLFAYNGFPLDRLPTLTHGDIESRDLKELGEYVKNLSAAGARLFPDDALENMLRAEAHLPELRRDEESPAMDPTDDDEGMGDE